VDLHERLGISQQRSSTAPSIRASPREAFLGTWRARIGTTASATTTWMISSATFVATVACGAVSGIASDTKVSSVAITTKTRTGRAVNRRTAAASNPPSTVAGSTSDR
jgi:hypothetical protein